MVRLVEPEWGTLARNESLTQTGIEEKALALLGQMSLREEIGQMSGDTPFLSGVIVICAG